MFQPKFTVGVGKQGFPTWFNFLLILLAGSFWLFSQPIAKAQFIPSNFGDQEAQVPNSAIGTRNTGTDFLAYPEAEGKGIQVMVWDGDKPQFSWDCDFSDPSGCKGSILLEPLGYTSYCDPDVVVGFLRGTSAIYAMVVGIAKRDGLDYIKATSFVYVGGGFSLHKECWMGQAKPAEEFSPDNFASQGRKCSSPNIDANSFGQVAITWLETETNSVRVTVHFPNPPLPIGPTDYLTTVSKGNVLGIEGYLDGGIKNGEGCLETRCRTFNQDPKHPFGEVAIGFPVGQPGEFEPDMRNAYVYAHPDVCISENMGSPEQSVVSFSFIRNQTGFTGVSPALQTGLLVYQKGFADCPDFKYKEAGTFNGVVIVNREGEDRLLNPIGGPPRIASTASTEPDYLWDYTVVQGSGGRDCNEDGYYYFSKVVAWTKRAGVCSDFPGSLILDINIEDELNFQPVVSHVSPKMAEQLASLGIPGSLPGLENFVVSWVIRDPIPGNTDDYEIVSKAYFTDGSLAPEIRYIGFGNGYSIVNNGTKGLQGIPSIAGRFGDGFMAYDWNNKNHNGNFYKRSFRIPGYEPVNNNCANCISGNYRMATENSFTDRLPESESGDFTVSPNPSKGSFVFQPGRQKEGEIEEISISDLSGKVLEVLKPKQGEKNLSWTPIAKSNKGVLIARVKTKSGTFSRKLVVE